MHSLICIILRQFAILIPLSIIFAFTGNIVLVWCALPISETFALFISFIFMKSFLVKNFTNQLIVKFRVHKHILDTTFNLLN